tara:strand:- start:2867 stop:4078 length:1212 start_codon:yes stop_codon:yes gene_type:complete
MRFILQSSSVKQVEFADGICALALSKMLVSARQNSFESVSLSNAMGYFAYNRQAKASLAELGNMKTKKLDVVESYIGYETLSRLLLAISRIQSLRAIRICTTWIEVEQTCYLARAIRRCSEICVSKCGLTSGHVRVLEDVLETCNIRKLDLSFNAIGCDGINRLLALLSRANNSALHTLALESTLDYIDDENGDSWDCVIFDTFCKAQPNLEVLDLGSNFLDDDFIYGNKKAFKRLKNLRTLKLAHNFITDYGVYKLSRFENKITNLDLNENPINSINVTHFTSRLFHHVQVLNMGGARLFNESLTTLTTCARMGIAFMNISHLYMDNCDFSDAHIYFIFDLVLNLTHLSILGLEDNQFSNYSHNYFCDQLKKITDREVCILMLDNLIDQTSEVPAPHCIITS